MEHEPPAPQQLSGYRHDESDKDPTETREWIESIEQVIAASGRDRARYLLRRVLSNAGRNGVMPVGPLVTDYVNTIPREEEPPFPGDEAMEKRIRRIIRWNAVAMVQRANKRFPGIGGHLSSYASIASLYEVGLNHFFRGKNAPGGGDHVFFQGHSAPGMYARAFLEGRISVDTLDHFRRETERGRGLPSYPHPRLVDNFWEYPTVSMGLGPLMSIYQARFNRYLAARGLSDTSQSRVWCFMGDGESDEPESLGALGVASREGLDNLTFVVNCNLQRLDGPVRGNGKIIQELEGIFRGAGWNVIKVIWGPEWDDLLARDVDGVLRRRMNEVVDGQWQKYTTEPGSYTRQHFFGTDPRLLAMVEHLSDEQIERLRRGGHSLRKIYAAYSQAIATKGRPTAILAHSVKGWTLGRHIAGANVTHQKKKLDHDELRAFRDTLELPVPDDKLEEAPFYHPGKDSPEVAYLLERRHALGGVIPTRRTQVSVPLEAPVASLYEEFYEGMKKGEASTTMVFARLLSKLIRDPTIGPRVVPIIPDEARTFGLDALFSQVGIYSSHGQLYEPVDKGKLLYYRETKDGQVLEEGITEAGAMASFIAAATAYSNRDLQMVPFFIYYSMFGFHRAGDLMWAAGDIKARGFLLGGTAGRTTLNGEGLQHQDGHSPLVMDVIPNMVVYDVAFAYELAVIIEEGLRRMLRNGEDVLYYITLQNENYPMPAMPGDVKESILRGIYRYSAAAERRALHVQLFGSGSILLEALRARDILTERFGVSADVWSVTSYGELRRDALECERQNRLNPASAPRVPHLAQALDGVPGPFVAVSDYLKLQAEQVARWVPGRLVPLGTDGFGMSDTRQALRRHFEIDAENIALAALDALRQDGKVEASLVARAVEELGVLPEKISPMSV
ncbi:MAG: pyruvate dehydrogenase (acetyl-transferring), homodimeric type [Sorangiineae bacterium]|nr:pyruvate dehydrogenase (acetyl-transferring), homodimeric type [Polyangiaceae bacterium]MEB2322097.1 pyruvate dehydrogenase (acetyl-transferring), homodimeric type [Sorangiineae bacterium]